MATKAYQQDSSHPTSAMEKEQDRLKKDGILKVTNEMDKHVDCIDMFSLLASDNIRFRLGVLRKTVFYSAGCNQRFYVDDDIINTYFQQAFRDAASEGDEELKERLNENRLSYIMHFTNRRKYAGYGTSTVSYLNNNIEDGCPMVFVSTKIAEDTEEEAHTRLRMLLSEIAKLTDDYWPRWHYAIIGDEDTSHTVAVWSDEKDDADGLKMTILAEAVSLGITIILAVEDGYADFLIMDGRYETFEMGTYDETLLKPYLDEKDEGNIPYVQIHEKWVEPLREVFKRDTDQQDALRYILKYNGFNTEDPTTNPDDIDNFDWYRLFKLATDTTKRIVPENWGEDDSGRW